MISTVQTLLPYVILVSHGVFVVLLLSLVFRKSWGKDLVYFVGKHSILLAFLVSLAAISGSLFYSEMVGFEPCILCWWQRVFIYPQVILFGTALWKRNKSAFLYSVPLISISTLISFYHEYVYLGGKSLLPCTALGGACSKIYVMAFGYITIPMMSLTAALFILLLAWAHRIYEKNSHTR